MSKLEERLKALKAQEERIRQEGFKIQFLQHVLDEAKANKLPQFKTVKDDVVSLLQTFIDKAVESIETEDSLVVLTGKENVSRQPAPPILVKQELEQPQPSVEKPKPEKKPEDEYDVNAKASFAMDNRHLSGKSVKIANPEDPSLPFSGTVVGLDAPFAVVQTENGPVIKVPLDKLVL